MSMLRLTEPQRASQSIDGGDRRAEPVDHAKLHQHPRLGVWMYPPQATIGLVNLIRAGLLRLDSFEATTFDLDHANDAVAHAASNSGPFKMTVIRP